MFSHTSLSLIGRWNVVRSLSRLSPRISNSQKLSYCKIGNQGSDGSAVASDGDDHASSSSSSTKTPANVSKGGFVKAMAKLEGHENFPKAVKFSPLMQMGDPQGKIAEGSIVHIVDDDLYIDFGGKFNCVCPRPHKNGSAYVIGKKVRIMIHDLELSTRFLGAQSDLTILEADCTLLGLARREFA